jgi:hypothetical protein
MLLRNVLFLGVAERPNFVDLDSFTGKVPQNAVLKFQAGFADIDEKFNDGILDCACHAGGRTDTVALYQTG